MTIVHIGNKHTCSLVKVSRVLLDCAVVRNTLDEYYLLAIRREAEALNLAVGLSELLAVASINIHAPYLTTTDKGYFLTTFYPGSIAFALTVGSELFFITSVSILNKEHSVTLVLLNTIIAHLISNLFAVG